MTPATPLPTDLLGLLWHLEACGWEYKLTSTQCQGGLRRFTASVWKPDNLGGSNKCAAPTPVQALTAALLDARRRRHRRVLQRRARQVQQEAKL